MTARLDRLRRMTPEEVAWRGTTALRTAGQRLEVRLRPPRWDRRALESVLAPGIVSPSVRAASAKGDWQAVHEALAHVLRARRARFVLDPELAGAVRAEIRERWPSAVPDAIARADRILAGHYDILGYRGLRFSGSDLALRSDSRASSDPDWHLDPAHGRHAPRQFWADVPYLDPAIGDHKVIWELNRQQHWLQLGRALWLTGDSRYGSAIVEQLESWLAANPPLVGINWASMLEIGFRTISWTWAIHFLSGHEAHEDGLATKDTKVTKQDDQNLRDLRDLRGQPSSCSSWLVDLFVALDRQLTHVEQNLSHYFSPNTHLTGEALALYVVGQALPELKSSDRWVQTGRRILLEEIDRQILPDGGHAERSMHYQRYTLDFYMQALLTAERVQDQVAMAPLRSAVTRLAEFTRTLADDRGRLPLIGDDDGGMLWPIAGRGCDDVRDSLAMAALILDRPDLAPWGIPEEAFWIAGREAIDRASFGKGDLGGRPPTGQEVVRSRALAESGYVVVRDSLGGHAVLDAGRHGYMNGGHAHADALAVTLTLDNRPLLVDAGTATYTIDAELRDRMRSSMSHNTVTVDGRPQSIPAGPFHWRTRADGRLHGTRHNAAFDWIEASHDGYAPLLHRRTLFRTSGGWLLVDDIAGDGSHSAAAFWHFDPAWAIACDAPGRLRATHADGETVWLLHDAGEIAIGRGETAGMGWHAPVYGTLVPAWYARVTVQQDAPFAMCTWIGASGVMPGAPPVLERIPAKCQEGERAIATRVTSGSRISVFIVRADALISSNSSCSAGHYETNARALHYAEAAGRLASLDLVDASHAFADRSGWISLSASAPMPDLHLAVEGDVLDVRASEPPAQLSVDGGLLQSVRTIRVNGRDLPPRGRLSNTIVIERPDWPAPRQGAPSDLPSPDSSPAHV